MFNKKPKQFIPTKRKMPETLKQQTGEETFMPLQKKAITKKLISADSKAVKEESLIQSQNVKRTYLQSKFITEKIPDEEKRNSRLGRRFITPEDIKGNQTISEIIKKEREMYKTPENLIFTKSYYKGNIEYEEEDFMKKKPPEETLEYANHTGTS